LVSVLVWVSVSIFVSVSGLSSTVDRVGGGEHSDLNFDGIEDEGEGIGAIEGKENAISGASSTGKDTSRGWEGDMGVIEYEWDAIPGVIEGVNLGSGSRTR
jgi:hypothetical protein